jgi:hypothetical protein
MRTIYALTGRARSDKRPRLPPVLRTLVTAVSTGVLRILSAATAMNEPKIIEVLAAEAEMAAAAGDVDRARKLADLLGRVTAWISDDVGADSATQPVAFPPGPEQLAPVARRISTEALSAELAAERGDWETVQATYERLAVLFAEYRLIYVRCLRETP